ncbi:MAG: hypothetical protein LBJ86_01805, partial [Spirochaetaceae bacterium]|nr:hypothetical protein [Spirochaetaceae bacterium]
MKKINLVIIGTLAAALLLSGCEQEPKEPSAAEKSAAALAAELGEGVEVNGSTVTVKIGETVAINADKPVTVAEGVTFNVPASSAVSVGSGAEFTVTGTVAVASGG